MSEYVEIDFGFSVAVRRLEQILGQIVKDSERAAPMTHEEAVTAAMFILRSANQTGAAQREGRVASGRTDPCPAEPVPPRHLFLLDTDGSRA